MKKVIVFGMSLMLLWSCNNSTEKSTTHQEPKLLNSTIAKSGW